MGALGASFSVRLIVGCCALFSVICHALDVDSSDLYLRNRRFDEETFEAHCPHNVTIIKTSYTFFYIGWEAPTTNETEIHNYEVKYRRTTEALNETSLHVPADTTTRYIKAIKPGTKYSFYVVANLSGLLTHSNTLTSLTMGYGPDRDCDCDKWGSASPITCNNHTGQCECRNKYTRGARCDHCYPGYYIHEHLGCQPCSCPAKTSNGTCHIDERGVLFCNCREGHMGTQCRLCDNAHYMIKGKCAPCKCNANANTSAARMCDVSTGRCVACIYNTTGDHCERCLPGYDGDALYRNCTSNASVVMSHQAVVVLVVCFVVALVSALVLVVVTLLRCRKSHKHRPFSFWSVQLRDDRENVNFSALRETPGASQERLDSELLAGDDLAYSDPRGTGGTLAFSPATAKT